MLFKVEIEFQTIIHTREYGNYTYENERIMTFYITMRPKIVAKQLQACSGQGAQPAQAGGYPYIYILVN